MTKDTDCGCDFAYAGGHEPSCPKSRDHNETKDTEGLLDELRELERDLEADTVPPTDWAADVVRRAIAALGEAGRRETQTWQPIETAPKDVNYVLLASPAHGLVIGAHVAGDVWHLVGVGAVTGASERPTRWMPLPPAPATPEE